MAQHPPDDPQAKQIATKDETISAWLALSPEDKIKLDVYAEQQARMRQKCAPGITGSDLLQDAWIAVLEGRRKWPLRRISFLSFLLGVVMSIAGDLPRTKVGKLAAATISEQTLLPETESATSSRTLEELLATNDSPEAIAIAKEQFAGFQSSFEDDETAWYVLEAMSEDLSGPQIQQKLGMPLTDFNAATKRIARRVRKFFVSN